MSSRPILLLDCYQDDAGALATFQPYLGAGSRQICAVRVAKGERLPVDFSAFSGVVVTGSAACLPDGVPWSGPLLDYIANSVRAGVPYLGVCFGHQCLAAALGGRERVRKMHQPEVGVGCIDVLDPRDPVLGRLAPSFQVLVSHEDEVSSDLPDDIVILARSEACDVHAIRVTGLPAWGVQFHTEMARDEVAALFLRRSRQHPQLALDPIAALAKWDSIKPVASIMFGAWLDIVDAHTLSLSA